MELRMLDTFSVFPIGLGCMGMSEFYGPADEAESHAVLEAALERGINHFDTADMYGYGHNERLLGDFLARHANQREHLLVATKCGIVRDPAEKSARVIDNTPEYIVAACEASLSRLGTHIDLYYLHRIAHGGRDIEQSMAGMARLLEAGRIRAVGLSEASAQTIERADSALRRLTGMRHGIAAVQAEYSLMTRTVEHNGVLAMCKRIGAALVAYSPISRGLLSGAVSSTAELAADDFRRALPRFAPAALAQNLRLVEHVRELADRRGIRPAQLALAWLLHRSPIVLPIPGTRQRRYLDENAAAASVRLDRALMEKLDALIAAYPVAGERYSPHVMSAFHMDA